MFESNSKILFLVRKNPDSIGGIQSHTERLTNSISYFFKVDSAVWRGPEWFFPIYYRSFYRKAIKSDADIIHCDDAVTAIVGAKIKRKTGKIVTATVHGLDVIFPFKQYQKKLISALKTIDHVICVSQATAEQVKSRGISEDKITVINNCADISGKLNIEKRTAISKIKKMTGHDVSGKKVLLSLGRPVKRKGFHKFASHALDKLGDDFVYIVAGPPPKIPGWIKLLKPIIGKNNYRLLLIASGADSEYDELTKISNNNFIYLGKISSELKELIFYVSNLFIMPNIKIDSDMEGFGIVALEASVRGVPVVAFAVDGITDAVIDDKNGGLIKPGDYDQMIGTIKSLNDNNDQLSRLGKESIEFTKKHFSPEKIHNQYVELFKRLS